MSQKKETFVLPEDKTIQKYIDNPLYIVLVYTAKSRV